MFTDATNDQLKAWGVVNVKNVELMDIRDAKDSQVISRIMAVKQSLVEKDSRVAVAANQQAAFTAEIEAKRQVSFRQQEADEAVGVRAAQKDQQVGIAGQQAQQAVKEQERTTAQKTMAVLEVNQVRQAEITRGVQVVNADQEKQMAVIRAEGEKQKTITVAEGILQQMKLNAEGVRAQGEAKGAAETAVLMAPVNSQIALAKEIGQNEGYQHYLVTVRQIEANQVVGIEQAKALTAAEIKVIANRLARSTASRRSWKCSRRREACSWAAAVEAFKNTEAGKAIVEFLPARKEAAQRARGLRVSPDILRSLAFGWADVCSTGDLTWRSAINLSRSFTCSFDNRRPSFERRQMTSLASSAHSSRIR